MNANGLAFLLKPTGGCRLLDAVVCLDLSGFLSGLRSFASCVDGQTHSQDDRAERQPRAAYSACGGIVERLFERVGIAAESADCVGELLAVYSCIPTPNVPVEAHERVRPAPLGASAVSLPGAAARG